MNAAQAHAAIAAAEDRWRRPLTTEELDRIEDDYERTRRGRAELQGDQDT